MAKAMISFSLCGDSWNQADSSVEGSARSCAQLTPLRLMNAWCNAWCDFTAIAFVPMDLPSAQLSLEGAITGLQQQLASCYRPCFQLLHGLEDCMQHPLTLCAAQAQCLLLQKHSPCPLSALRQHELLCIQEPCAELVPSSPGCLSQVPHMFGLMLFFCHLGHVFQNDDFGLSSMKVGNEVLASAS